MATLSPPPTTWASAELQEVRSVACARNRRYPRPAMSVGRGAHMPLLPPAPDAPHSCDRPLPYPWPQALAGQYYVLPWRGPLASMGRSLVRSDGTWLGEQQRRHVCGPLLEQASSRRRWHCSLQGLMEHSSHSTCL